jgi:hypothetical protein
MIQQRSNFTNMFSLIYIQKAYIIENKSYISFEI